MAARDKVRLQIGTKNHNGKVSDFIDITIGQRQPTFTVKTDADSVFDDLREWTVPKYDNATAKTNAQNSGTFSVSPTEQALFHIIMSAAPDDPVEALIQRRLRP